MGAEYQRSQTARCWQCRRLWETECECPMPDPMVDPDGYAEYIERDHRRGARKEAADARTKLE
jgi:hypothetical protein